MPAVRARQSPNLRPPEREPRTAVYAGMFDPPTLAHMAIIETAVRMFDRLVVVVGVNLAKSRTMFSTEERVEMLRASIPDEYRPLVEVMAYDGLTAPLAERLGACALVRGMRPVTDPEYEIALALMNAKLAPSLPTVLLVAKAENVYLSSTFVREVASLDGRIVPGTVPPPVERVLRERFGHLAAKRQMSEEAARSLARSLAANGHTGSAAETSTRQPARRRSRRAASG